MNDDDDAEELYASLGAVFVALYLVPMIVGE